jgi:23S rRNA (adenine2503-C2)-methyltransferase
MIETTQKDIRSLSLEKVKESFVANGEKAFRAKQVFEWLWKKSATSFEEMTNLSLKTREWLSTHFVINSVTIDSVQESNDGTIKYIFKLHDGHKVEGVLIPTDKRITVCISTQVGCSLSCSFCATGFMARKRNLDAAEIYDQVVLVKKEAERLLNRPLTNIVYMGMGEPLLNFANTVKSTELICNDEGLGMSPRRITISTAGIAKMIEKLGDEEVKFNLALSLHAANDLKRNEIMPINSKNTLKVLEKSLNYFYEKTKNKITLEYIVFSKFNDTLKDAEELLAFAKRVPCKVNIIEYNPIEQAEFLNADEDAIDQFKELLEDNGVIVNVRRSRGKDIDAACGQLAGKEKVA